MIALELLKDYKNIDFGCNMDDLHSQIDEAIKELEFLQNENKTLVTILEKYNEEMIELRKENQELLKVINEANSLIQNILKDRKWATNLKKLKQ